MPVSCTGKLCNSKGNAPRASTQAQARLLLGAGEAVWRQHVGAFQRLCLLHCRHALSRWRCKGSCRCQGRAGWRRRQGQERGCRGRALRCRQWWRACRCCGWQGCGLDGGDDCHWRWAGLWGRRPGRGLCWQGSCCGRWCSFRHRWECRWPDSRDRRRCRLWCGSWRQRLGHSAICQHWRLGGSWWWDWNWRDGSRQGGWDDWCCCHQRWRRGLGCWRQCRGRGRRQHTRGSGAWWRLERRRWRY